MTVHKTFALKGMSCAACAVANEHAVGKVKGVAKVSVNLATERMDVDFDPLEADCFKIETPSKRPAMKPCCLKNRHRHRFRPTKPTVGSALLSLQYLLP